MMKKHIKFIGLLFVFLTSAACSLPFLAGNSSDPEPTEAVITAIPTLPQPTPAEVSSGNDPCLTGVWTMDTYALNNKFLDLTHSPIMYVVAPSSMIMELNADGNYVINGETIVQADIPGGSDYMQMTGTHSGQGRYSADGSSLFLSDSTYTVAFGMMTISIDGEVSESPISTLVPNSTFTMPDDFMSPPSTAAYQCSASQLLVTYDGPSGQVTEEWNR